MIKIYTDGGCRKNPGIGAWAAYIELEEHTKYLIGKGLQETTNNQMELTAPLEALFLLNKLKLLSDGNITVLSDSSYVVNSMTKWADNWAKNGWRTKSKEPIKNKELIEQLYQFCLDYHIHFTWVESHSGIYGNELCDQTVNEIMDKIEEGFVDYKVKKSIYIDKNSNR